MKIEMYEQLKTNIAQFETNRKELQYQRETAAKEMQLARQQLSDLTDTPSGGATEFAQKLVTAQATVIMAEAKLRRVEQELKDFPERPAGCSGAYTTIHGAIRCSKSEILKEFQPILDEMAELRQAYLDKLRILFMKQNEINDKLSSVQGDAKSIEEKYAEKVVHSSSVGYALIAVDDFRKWIWVQRDHEEAFNRVYREVNPPISGPCVPPNIRVIPRQTP